MTIRILKGGSPEYACYPLEKSVGPPEDVIKRHPDWKHIKCPVCGRPCYQSDLAREAIKKGIKGACTSCTLELTAGM